MISLSSHGAIYHCSVKNAFQTTVDGQFTKNIFFEGAKFSVDTTSGKIMGGLINTNTSKTIEIIDKGEDINNFKMQAIYGLNFNEMMLLEIKNNRYWHQLKKYPFSMYFNERSLAGICEK